MLGSEINPSNPRETHTPPSSHIPPLEFDANAGWVCNEVEECIGSRGNKNKPAQRKQKKGKKILNNSNNSKAVWQGSKLWTPRKLAVAVCDCSQFEFSGTDSESPEPPPTSRIHGPRRKPKLDALLNKNRKGCWVHWPTWIQIKFVSALASTSDEELFPSDDWSNCYVGLQTRMARYRPKLLLRYLGPILWFAFKHLTSPYGSHDCDVQGALPKDRLSIDVENLPEKPVKEAGGGMRQRNRGPWFTTAAWSRCSRRWTLWATAACQRMARMIG